MPAQIHTHDDAGLSPPAIRKRRRSRRLGQILLVVATVTAVAGWKLYGSSLFSAIRIKDQPESQALIAYALLIVSSVTLILGLWYLLLAQVERLAHIANASDLTPPPAANCPHCHHHFDPPDRFCRHCGHAL